jgi:hypothetical protein
VNATRLASRLPGFAALMLVLPAAATAQSARLRVTGGPVRFAAPTVSDFETGYIDAPSALTYTVRGRGAARDRTARTTIISIRASSPTIHGTVPVSTLQWRRGDLSAWNPLSTVDANVESRPFVRNTTNDPWSNTIYFRLDLSYGADTPGVYSVNLIITLTATTP